MLQEVGSFQRQDIIMGPQMHMRRATQNYIDTCPPKGDNTELREPHSPVPIVLPSGNHSEIVTAKEDVTMEGACTCTLGLNFLWISICFKQRTGFFYLAFCFLLLDF